MDFNHYNDNLAIIALCTNLGDPKSIINPLTNIQYNLFANRLFSSSLKSPIGLLEKIDQLDLYWEELKISYDLKNRISYLLSPERIIRVYLAVEELKTRSIQIITRASKIYPNVIKSKLKEKRPPVIFYIGNLELLETPIVGIVGSRDIDINDEKFVEETVKKLLTENKTIISGGAKGSDKKAEEYALMNNGNIVLFLSSEMIKRIKESKVIKHIINNKMLIISEEIPSAHFKVYSAMSRNKYIYCLSDYVIVVKSDYKKGGTWTGAEEALKHKYCDLYVKDNKSNGFKGLIALGAKVLNENNNITYSVKSKSLEQLSLFEDQNIK